MSDTECDCYGAYLELLDDAIDSISRAIRQEIAVRECELGCSQDGDKGIEALRWALSIVEDTA